MSALRAYLTFSGNCREAMEFYRDCFGGSLYFQTLADGPRTRKLPAAMRKKILHADLQAENFSLVGSDITPGGGLQQGNTISLLLQCKSIRTLRRQYRQLAGDKATRLPLADGKQPLTTNLTDPFGINWILFYPGKTAKQKQ